MRNPLANSRTTYLVAAAVITVVVGLNPQGATAAPVFIDFSGIVDTVADPDQVLDPSIAAGATFVGSTMYEPLGAVDSNPTNPQHGAYEFDSTLTIHVGNVVFETEKLHVGIGDNLGTGFDDIALFDSSLSTPGFDELIMTVLLRDLNGTALESDELPTFFHLSDFSDLRSIEITENVGGVDIQGEITSLTVTPEPTTTALLLLGILVWTWQNPHERSRAIRIARTSSS